MMQKFNLQLLVEEPPGDMRLGKADQLTVDRRKAYEALRKIGLPNRSLEGWKNVDLSDIQKNHFQSLEEGYRVEGCDNPSISYELLNSFEPNHKKSIEDLFKKRKLDTSNHLDMINVLTFNRLLHLKVKKTNESTKPIRIKIVGEKDVSLNNSMVQPRIFIDIESNAKVMLLIDLDDPTLDHIEWLNTYCNIHMNDHAELDCIYVGKPRDKSNIFHTTYVRLGKRAKFNQYDFLPDSPLTRKETRILFAEEGAEANFKGLVMLKESGRVFNHIMVDHQASHCRSDQIYKAIVNGSSVTEFNSLVRVKDGALESKSYQLNKNILLSDHARVFSRPQLKIDTDDVECRHGATVGQLDPQEILYLRTRGIDEPVAKELILSGFAKEIILAIPHGASRGKVNDIVTHAYGLKGA